MSLWAVGDAALRRAATPVQLNFVEGFVVADSLRAAEGGPLYNDPRQAPFTVNVYTPLYTVVLAGLARAGAAPFLAGRLLALGGAVAIAVIVAVSGWRRSRTVALAAASLFLLAPLQWPWSLVLRPDTLAVALSVAGVALVARREGGRLPWATVLFFVAAFFTKQTAVAGAAAALLAVARVRPRRALSAGIAGCAAVVAAALALQWASGGWFLFHTVAGNLNPFSLARAGALWSDFLRSHAVEVLVLVALAAVQVARRRLDVVGIYAVLACLVATSAGKAGSDLNYFLEPLAAAALLAAHAFPVKPPMRYRRLSAPLGAMLLAGAAGLGFVHLRDQLSRRAPLAAAETAAQEVAGRLRGIAGDMVSDDASLLLRAGKRVIFQPFVMAQLAESGRWDETPFLEALRNGRIGAVVVQTGPRAVTATRYSPAMHAVLAKRFRPSWGFVLGFPYTVLEPR